MTGTHDSDGWYEIEVSYPDPVYPGDEVFAKDRDGVERWLSVHKVEDTATAGLGPHTLIIAIDRSYGMLYGSARSQQFIKHVERSEHAFHALRVRRRGV